MFKIQARDKLKKKIFKTWYYSTMKSYRKWIADHRRFYGRVYDITGYRFRGGRWETLK